MADAEQNDFENLNAVRQQRRCSQHTVALRLIGLYSRSHDKAEALAARMPQAPKVCGCIEELIALKPDYVVEAASPAAMRELALPALRGGSSVVTLSIGAFADDDFYAEVMTTAKACGTRVYVVSGATGLVPRIRILTPESVPEPVDICTPAACP